VFSSKSSVVQYVVFLLANLFQVWVAVPAGINTIYGQQSGSKHLASRSMCCMVQNGLWTMVWLLTTSWVYLHGLWSQLATTLGSIWDLASLTGAVDGLKLCLVAKKHGSTFVPSNQVCQPLAQTRTLYPLVSKTLSILCLHGTLVLPLFMAWALAAATKQMLLAQAHACHVPYMGCKKAFDMNCETLFADILPHIWCHS